MLWLFSAERRRKRRSIKKSIKDFKRKLKQLKKTARKAGLSRTQVKDLVLSVRKYKIKQIANTHIKLNLQGLDL